MGLAHLETSDGLRCTSYAMGAVKQQIAIPLVAFTMVGGDSLVGAAKAAFAAAVRAPCQALRKRREWLLEKALEGVAWVVVKGVLALVGKFVVTPVLVLVFSQIPVSATVCANMREEEGPHWSSAACPLPHKAAATTTRGGMRPKHPSR